MLDLAPGFHCNGNTLKQLLDTPSVFSLRERTGLPNERDRKRKDDYGRKHG